MKKLFLLTFLLVFALAACSCQKAGPADDAAEGMPELYEQYKAMAGKWQGQWKNTTFGSTGASNATVQVNEDGTASFTIDVDGLVFGMVNPDPKIFSGTYNDKGIIIEQKDDLFGDVVITITRTGENKADIDLKCSNITTPGIGSLSATGTLDAGEMHVDYEVGFTPSGSAKGVMDMAKVE